MAHSPAEEYGAETSEDEKARTHQGEENADDADDADEARTTAAAADDDERRRRSF